MENVTDSDLIMAEMKPSDASIAAVSSPGPSQSTVLKPVHTIILDSSPLLLNHPSISTLLANSHVLVTLPSVISEIRDKAARERIDTLYRPFVTLRTPKLESVKFVKEFARKTGDGAVLSRTDVEVIALAYDLECERNGGDWRLRSVPGQKRCNGSRPEKSGPQMEDTLPQLQRTEGSHEVALVSHELSSARLDGDSSGKAPSDETQTEQGPDQPDVSQTEDTHGVDIAGELSINEEQLSSESDSEGWITPSNIKKHQAKDQPGSSSTGTAPKMMQVATITGDFAMQNVLLQMNLNLLSPNTCKRIGHIKQAILRCHGCFATTKEMDRQFCARCGKPTLTRVSCTTNDRGEVKLHLKANMQWNNKGNVFSIPKPTPGSANQKWKGPKQGGGQKGWGNDLILAEDQKEYARATTTQKRTKAKDLMDEDYLPSILTGDRHRGAERVRVGAGRNINARKR